MKQIYVFILALLAPGIHAFAGAKSEAAVTGVTWTGGLFPHFSNQGKGVQGSNSRLVAKTFLKFDAGVFVPVDSVTYKYSNGRGGMTKKDEPNNDENILFDESVSYVYNSLQAAYNNKMHRIQDFNIDNTVERLTYRSWRNMQTGGGIWKDSARYSYLYTNGIMTSSVYEIQAGGLWNKHVQSQLIYDSKNNVTQMNSTSYIATFSYDGNNNLVSVVDSLQMPSGTWVLNQKKSYDYDVDGNISVYTLEKWDATSATWLKDSRWEYSYSGKNIATSTETHWNGWGWENTNKHAYNYDNNNNKTEDVTQIWNASANSFVNSRKENWTYNSYNQPERIISYSWNGNSWINGQNDQELRFYYEHYFPTGTQNITADNDILVYPTMASNEVNIMVSHAGSHSTITVMLYDMNGRLVRNQPMEQTSMTMSVADLMPGNYIVKISAEEGVHTSRIIVNH